MRMQRWVHGLSRPAVWFWTATCLFSPALAEEPEKEESSPVKISHEGGVISLTLSPETQEHIGLNVSEVHAAEHQPTMVGFGRLEQDPAGMFALRAPIAGTLRSSEGRDWPALGAHLDPGNSIGFIEPRLTPLETADVQSRWVDALAEIEEGRADLDAARASLEQKKRLNTEQGLVSDRSLEETQARTRNAEARLAAAQKRGELYEALVKGQGRNGALFPLDLPDGGEIVELAARPGEVVDAGQILLRTVQADALLARVFLFAGDAARPSKDPTQLQFSTLGDATVAAIWVGLAPQVGATTGGQALLYRVEESGDLPLRPGMTFEAHIPTEGEPLHGVVVPRSALLRHAGLTWVYLQAEGDRFERRSCVLNSPSKDGWFVSEGLSDGDKVVVEGAQLLLSEELKSQIESEEAAEK